METDASPDWPSEPARHDRLLYGIGRVCEAHVLLDWNLNIAHAELAILANPLDPEQAFVPASSTAACIGRCEDLLTQRPLPKDLTTAGADALDEARAANQLRNRVVHDVWIERLSADDGPAFNRIRLMDRGMDDKPSDLAYVNDAARRLVQVSERVNALAGAMGRLRAAPGVPIPEELGYQQMLPAIRGESRPAEG